MPHKLQGRMSLQVHEEVLRLILVAAPQLSVPQVAQYLQNTINNSKRSRRCALPFASSP